MARNQEVKKQLNVLKKIYGKCKETQLESNVTDSGSCGLYWDGMYCWPRTAIGTDSIQQCPSYVEKFNNEGLMKRYCTENGTWIKDSNHTYDDCWKKQLDDITLTEEYLDEMKVIAVVGYSVSLLTLLIACFVLIIHPKLRCPRNDLHLNLFTSFVIRCVSCICKDYLLTNGSIGFIWTVSEEFPHGKPDIGCKFLISVWHYSLMVNYSWILMEGLYLHNLIFLGFFNERAGIGLYTKLGWSE
ncbi:PTH1R (predicted) [Pycnogonum litorale]